MVTEYGKLTMEVGKEWRNLEWKVVREWVKLRVEGGEGMGENKRGRR